MFLEVNSNRGRASNFFLKGSQALDDGIDGGVDVSELESAVGNLIKSRRKKTHFGRMRLGQITTARGTLEPKRSIQEDHHIFHLFVLGVRCINAAMSRTRMRLPGRELSP